jgi:hypothetical protein
VNTPWSAHQHAGERWAASVSTTTRPDLLVADQGERADGDLAAELVGHRR